MSYHKILWLWISSVLHWRQNKIYISLSFSECFSFLQASCCTSWQGRSGPLWVLAYRTRWNPSIPAHSCQSLSGQIQRLQFALYRLSLVMTFALWSVHRKSNILLLRWPYMWLTDGAHTQHILCAQNTLNICCVTAGPVYNEQIRFTAHALSDLYCSGVELCMGTKHFWYFCMFQLFARLSCGMSFWTSVLNALFPSSQDFWVASNNCKAAL